MKNVTTVVVGGGASGMVAAISAARAGASVTICDRMARIGKKVLASGNGRCNLSNERLESSSFNPAARRLTESVFSRFGGDGIKNFFRSLGLYVYADPAGRIFPVTNQSSSVLKVLELEIARCGVRVEHDFCAARITPSSGGYIVSSKDGRRISSRTVILACGGRSYPALGSDGSGYELARSFGHSIVEPVPSAVPVTVKDRLCHILQGQKVASVARAVVGGKVLTEAEGELLFTKYGLSGTAILDISEEVSLAINRKREGAVEIEVDMVPTIGEDDLDAELRRRSAVKYPAHDLLAGILPNKFGPAFEDSLNGAAARNLKHARFTVTGTRGWNEAEFTAGGVRVDEIDHVTLGSKLRKGIYMCGEMLDVNGRRGGFNLAWAWASGHIAGEASLHA